MKKILVLLGNPDVESYSGAVASRYQDVAEESGHEVRRINISELSFDPILHHGYSVVQDLEPDLLMVQEAVGWADHVVIVYPNWWCTMPAILKGLFDRMWLPGFAFNFEKESGKCIQRLKGKTGRVIIVCGTSSPFTTWWKYGDFTNEIVHGTLGFAGIKTKATAFGPTQKASDAQKEDWLNEVSRLALRAK